MKLRCFGKIQTGGFEQIDGRFEQINGWFGHIEGHLSDIRKNIKIIAERFDCDYLILGNGVEGIKKRLILWEEKLNLPHPGNEGGSHF